MGTIHFEERQTFRQPWLLALMLGVLVVLVLALALTPDTPALLWLILLAPGLAFLLLFSIKMSVQVDDEAVRIRYFPLWRKTIPLADIARFEPRVYRPILEYGGWGIRYGFSHGWAYNVRGNWGVQLELVNGQRILIGSQRSDELAQAIRTAKGT